MAITCVFISEPRSRENRASPVIVASYNSTRARRAFGVRGNRHGSLVAAVRSKSVWWTLSGRMSGGEGAGEPAGLPNPLGFILAIV